MKAKNKANQSAIYAIAMSSVLAMHCFVVGAMAKDQSTKENFLLAMGFFEIVIIYSLITLFINKKSRNEI